ncbi:hypothetical protein GJ744_007911 [Endocarpon pusillum]|uniref:Uncharacterized protein n=1 Tax=Endocarpon pusillum TaxID=364733 RepID=A0A8H7AM61_9EURO|nr:hypothetical protein GJ744_007911 [Endocarpon pusillum]
MVGFDFSERESHLQSALHHDVHDTNDKNGAFENETSASTDVLDTIKIFMDPALTTEWEKGQVQSYGSD